MAGQTSKGKKGEREQKPRIRITSSGLTPTDLAVFVSDILRPLHTNPMIIFNPKTALPFIRLLNILYGVTKSKQRKATEGKQRKAKQSRGKGREGKERDSTQDLERQNNM